MTDNMTQIDMFAKSWINRELVYFGQKVTILAEDKTHVLIQFDDGGKICTNKNTHVDMKHIPSDKRQDCVDVLKLIWH